MPPPPDPPWDSIVYGKGFDTSYVWNVFAQVLDTIKGKKLPDMNDAVYIESVIIDDTTLNHPVHYWPFSVYDAETGTKKVPSPETNFIYEFPKGWALGNNIGTEYIIFCWQYGGCMTEYFDYYTITPLKGNGNRQGVYGSMEIID